jgi:AcrR family transcriptional regulator
MGVAERKQREKELRRSQILEAAEKIFIKKGLQMTTMDEIADACELSKGTVYLYFKNKEELIFNSLIGILDTFIGIIESNLSQCTTYESRAASIGESYLEFYKKHPSQFMILNHSEHHERPDVAFSDLEKELLLRNSRLWQIVEGVISEGIDLGIYRSDINPLEIGIMLWASSNGMIQVMDHIKQVHHCNPEKAVPDLDVFGHQFLNLDYEKMLRNLWAAIIQSIRI